MKIKVNIEIGIDGGCNAYMPDNPLPFGAIGEGTSAKAAKDDFLATAVSFAEDYPHSLDNVDFVFQYDTRSLLDYYRHIFTLEGMSRITGISAGQLSHYLNGVRKPSQKTVSKMETALRKFGGELVSLSLI